VLITVSISADKGLELINADDPRVWKAGRELLERVFAEHPDDAVQVMLAHDALAESLA
jgi:hypothetical protein